jgi:hypothetical protein
MGPESEAVVHHKSSRSRTIPKVDPAAETEAARNWQLWKPLSFEEAVRTGVFYIERHRGRGHARMFRLPGRVVEKVGCIPSPERAWALLQLIEGNR